MRWALFAGGTLLLAALVTAFLVIPSSEPLSGVTRIYALSVFYGTFIGFPSMLVMPAVGRHAMHGPPVAALLRCMAACAAITAVMMTLATVTLTGLGAFPASALKRHLVIDGGIGLALSLPAGLCAFAYSRMAGRIRKRDARLREAEALRERAELLEAEARFDALSARLQPHFLFNTLNSIATLVREDPRAAEAMVERLASVLRSSLDAGAGRQVPLQRELDLVSDYLELERVRLGARLRCALDVQPGLERIAVPPFSVQTLVENAVKYAVAQRREGGEVQVTVFADAHHLRIEVRDDGPGISGAPPPGHGLDMLTRRLASSFGPDEAGLSISSGEGGAGACVRVWLPRTDAT
ncbi:Sensor protein lytS [Myxococcus stipitatus DSM 14675]|uniref:Sensor protein lytS n=1 Tax=Myxococcus stipitatus (strain DSM 14675 / JCM 12634 / Mx s8) TaxID=1278073 RepID=L7UBB6_MYXSD|nr:histidine kinase [Myxococcus stipitatus]AGC45343.1 Sensor protein lytS [Myxococcus stipitatus DSM 14675]